MRRRPAGVGPVVQRPEGMAQEDKRYGSQRPEDAQAEADVKTVADRIRPVIDHRRQRIVTIPFHATVPLNATRSYASKRITSPFVIRELRTSFALNCNRTLQVSFWLSPDPETPNGQPSGYSLLSPLGQVDYLVGDDEQKILPHEVYVDAAGMYLKVMAVNSDGFDHTLDAQIVIALKPRVE